MPADPIEDPAPPPSPSPAPSAPVDDPRLAIATQLALADAMKPIEAAVNDLYAPERQATQAAIADKYAKAIAVDGDLRKKVDVASAKFDRAAADMLGRLDDWAKKFATGALHDLLEVRKATGAALGTKKGAREQARDTSLDTAKAWAARFADWSAPADAIGKLVSGYIDRVDKLNADINNDVGSDAAILSFWFDIAPKHLPLSDKALSASATSALTKVRDAAAAAGYADLAAALDPATARGAGGVYVIAAADLPAKRKSVLTGWKDAALARATAEAAFKLDPDDVATLKARWDKLRDDVWLKDASAALNPA
jgi:hypothetical protein